MSTQETMMKTLHQTLRTILLALALIGTASNASAYDMAVDGVFYNINGNEATVTYIDHYIINGSDKYNYYSKYIGHITIPKTVIYNGLSYTVTAIGEYAFNNCTSLTSVSIPETVKIIGSNSFANCDGLINITIPITVTTINSQTFFDCDGLSSVTIPDSVTTIKDHAFYNCDNLTRVTIGGAVTSIGINAFNSTPLSYITCLADTPPSVNSFAFSSFVNTTLYVPSASIEAYRNASVWSDFKIITDFKPNYLSLVDDTVMHGDTIMIPVMMENENDITAFQTDIYLVEGFEVVKDENEESMVTLSERKGRDHVIMASDAPDGAVRVVSYSPTLKKYSGNEGPLFYITVKAPENGDGVYPVIVKNTRLTTTDDEEVLSPDAYCNVTVLSFILGDVNGSGDITVADVVLTAKYILFQNPEPFIFGAADLNGDGMITITDVVKIAHLVLDADYGEPTKRLTSSGNSGDCMSGEMSQQSVAVSLENEQSYTAFQLDLTLPEGMTASGFSLAERDKDLGLIVKDRGNGKIRVLGYTADLKTIKDSDGALLTFDVEGAGEILVDNIQLVSLEGQTVLLDGFTIGANTMTSVKELNASRAVARVDYFNMTGQRIDCPENGVTLVVTTYTDGTHTTAKVIKLK